MDNPGRVIPARVCGLCYHDKSTAKDCRRPDCTERPRMIDALMAPFNKHPRAGE